MSFLQQPMTPWWQTVTNLIKSSSNYSLIKLRKPNQSSNISIYHWSYNTVVSHSCRYVLHWDGLYIHTVMEVHVFEKSSYSTFSQASKFTQSNFLWIIYWPNTLYYSSENHCCTNMHEQGTGSFVWQLLQKYEHFWLTFVSLKPPLLHRERFSESKRILNKSRDSCLRLFEKIK